MHVEEHPQTHMRQVDEIRLNMLTPVTNVYDIKARDDSDTDAGSFVRNLRISSDCSNILLL